MRYAFGLVSLLVVTAIIMWLFSMYEIPIAKKGKETQDQAHIIKGDTPDGIRAQDSVKVDGQVSNGQLRSLLVTDVTPNGYFDINYGLKKGDKVLQLGGVDVGAMGSDPSMAEAELWQVQGKQITILRNGQTLTLNADVKLNSAGAAAVDPTATPATAPSTPSPFGGSGVPGLPAGVQVPAPRQ